MKNKPKNKLDNSRDLQIWIWSNKPAIKDAANFIFKKMINLEVCSDFKKNRLKNYLKVILTDLFVAHKHDNKVYNSISLNKNDYHKHKYFGKIYLNYRYVVFIIDFLKEQGYVEFHVGVYTPRFQRLSRMKATKKLLRLFRKYDKPGGIILSRKPPIILKDNDKKEIDFDIDSIETRQIIRNVNRINKYLSTHSIEHTNYEKAHISEAMLMNNTKYHRVFNNSNFKNGGRFYGHWSQQIESEQRRQILIDGMSTVELDYSCLHISMLYGLNNMFPPEGDLYELNNIPSNYRKVIKKAVNIAINAKNLRDSYMAINIEMKEFCNNTGLLYIRPKVLVAEILERHDAIRNYFCTGFGVNLQFIDSKIAEKIMLTLGEEGIGCLCIHDSFIVAKEYKERLEYLMKVIFYERFNFLPNVSVK